MRCEVDDLYCWAATRRMDCLECWTVIAALSRSQNDSKNAATILTLSSHAKSVFMIRLLKVVIRVYCLRLRELRRLCFLIVIVWSCHKWTRTTSGMSVIRSWWNWTESGTRCTPALECYLLTFWRWKCHIHALTVHKVIYSHHASSNVSYFIFLWLMWSVVYMK